MARSYVSSAIILVLITQANTQFFDFIGLPSVTQSANIFNNGYLTRKTKIDANNPNPQMIWKNTTYSFSYDGIEKDNSRQRETPREKKKRPSSIPTLLPIFNFYTSTEKPVKKTTKISTNTSNNNRQNNRNSYPNRQLNSDDVGLSKNSYNEFNDIPVNNINNRSYETITRGYNNNNNDNTNVVGYNNRNDYTTETYYSRPGVKPIVVDNRPPITNKPVTQRPYRPDNDKPYWPVTQRPYRPETQNPYRPETERPYRPVTQRPYKPETERPYRPETENPYRPVTQRPFRPETQRPTQKPTIKPYIVHPIPTQAGAVVFPNEDDPPEIIRGPDEDYMSDAEKRRHVEMAEKMCDKYKSLNTKQLSAIPLLPSPEPVSLNVTECTPTQIPLVVGGKVVTVSEFPHMALLGWIKIEDAGYSWKCGGSLISDQHILTAAHCSYEERDNTVVTGPPRVVQLGSSYLDDPGALVVKVAAIIRHPKYKFPRSYYDLAIVKLLQPVSFSEVIKPACLGVPPPVDQHIIATGWGKTEFGGDQSVDLRSVSLPVWNMEKCSEILGTSRRMPDGPQGDSQVCAGEKRGGKDTCQGDSGGPAQLQDGCVWRVVAVTSLGRSCGAPNTPGLYAIAQRAFISAAIFGNAKNNQRRSDNTQNNDYNRSNRNDYRTTADPYNSRQNNNDWKNGNIESAYSNQNNNRNGNSNDDYNNNSEHNQNRRDNHDSNDNYNYNSGRNQNSQSNHDSNDDYNSRRNQNSRGTDTGYYNQQKEEIPSYSNLGYNQPQGDYWARNQPQSRYEGPVWFT